MTDLLQELVRIGAIQFGQFEQIDGTFAPLNINLQIIPSYPRLMQALANELIPLIKIDSATHLLASPSTIPLATAVSLIADMPLVYPIGDTIEGAYDFNVPTVLLTDVFHNGNTENDITNRVKGLGLDIKAVTAVFSLGIETSLKDIKLQYWHTIPDILSDIAPAPLQRVVQNWLNSL
jgi:uridine monophosphate synthetase